MRRLAFLGDELARIDSEGRRRWLRVAAGAPGPVIELDGRPVINLSANNYLGLAGDPRLAAAAREALDQGSGSTASRLIAGNRAEHQALENELAGFHGAEGARLFNSGFQANVGIIDALAGAGDLILSDALNHASLIDGCRLSGARVVVYPHGDVGAVARLLAEHRAGARRCFLVTDALFSMDGDVAPVAALAQLADDHDAALVVDEAHAVGAQGDGRGVCAAAGVIPEVLVGTLGKAFGAFGAYAVGSAELAEFLLHRARSFVFTTALPASVVAAGRTGLAIAASAEGAMRREQLAARIRQLAEGLAARTLLAPGAGGSAIFPVLLGAEARALAWCNALLERGFFVQAIRPPTVPAGSSRLRVALMADHEPTQIDGFLRALDQVKAAELG